MEQDYSKETLEILGKTPGRFTRYGLSVFFLILIGILVGISRIDYHDTFKTQVSIIDAGNRSDIIYENGEYLARIVVNATDIWKIKEGAEVIINLNQYPKNVYGLISGNVIFFSHNDKQQVYEVFIQLPNGLTTTFGKELEYFPDLSGIALVKGQKKSIFERIFFSVLSDN